MYLGCTHEEGIIKFGDIIARTMTYNMEDFLSSCVDRYLELAGNGVKLKTVATPFLNEDQGISPQGAPCEPGPFCECPWCKHTFPANVHKPAKDVSWNMNKGKALANVRQDATHKTSDRKLYALSELRNRNGVMNKPKMVIIMLHLLRIVRIMGGRPLLHHLIRVVFSLSLRRFL